MREPEVYCFYEDGTILVFSARSSTRREREERGPMTMQALVIYEPVPLVIRVRTNRDAFHRVVSLKYSPQSDEIIESRMHFVIGTAVVHVSENGIPLVEVERICRETS